MSAKRNTAFGDTPGDDAIRHRVSQIMGADASTAGKTGAAPLEDMIGAKIPAWAAGIDDILDRGLEGARPVGFKYFVFREKKPIGIAESELVEGRARFSSLTTDGSVQNLLRAMEIADRQPDSETCEARLFEAAALYVSAVWFHEPAAGFLVPVGPAPPPLNADVRYSAVDFTEALRQLAERKRRLDEQLGERE